MEDILINDWTLYYYVTHWQLLIVQGQLVPKFKILLDACKYHNTLRV